MLDFESEYIIGLKYLHGIGMAMDTEKAFVHISRSAFQGYVRAQVSLAFMHLDGISVSQNKSKAFVRFKVAAIEENHTRATLMVGLMLEHGEGIEQDIEKALKYYKVAANQGNMDALDKLND